MRKSETTSPDVNEEEKNFEQTLRPHDLIEFVGQKKITQNLNVFISAAQKRKEALERVQKGLKELEDYR